MDTKLLGKVAYLPTFEAMQAFTAQRHASTPDELWVCEHPPVFTQGLAGKAEHLLVPGNIPVYGYIYDVKTGRLNEVEAATLAGRPSTPG